MAEQDKSQKKQKTEGGSTSSSLEDDESKANLSEIVEYMTWLESLGGLSCSNQKIMWSKAEDGDRVSRSKSSFAK